MLKFNGDEWETIRHALDVAGNRYAEDAKVLRQSAEAIRAGETVFPFAPGEDGARAADRLADQFERQKREVDELIERIDDREEG